MSFRYVASIMETFILFRQFAKLPEVKSPKQEIMDFWMELLLQTYKPTVSTGRCPVRQQRDASDTFMLCLLCFVPEIVFLRYKLVTQF